MSSRSRLILVVVIVVGFGAVVSAITMTKAREPQQTEQGAIRDVSGESDHAEEQRVLHDYSAMQGLLASGIDRLRMPTPDEMQKLRPLWPTVPLEENAVYYYAKAARDLNKRWSLSHPEPPGSLSGDNPYAGDAAGFMAYIQENQDVLAAVREAVTTYSFQAPPLIDKQKGNPNAHAFLGDVRNLARFLCDAGFAAELAGDANLAAERYLDCMRMGRQIRQRGPLMTELVGIAVESMGQKELHALMANASLNKDVLESIIAFCGQGLVTVDDRLEVLRQEEELAKAMMAPSAEDAQEFSKEDKACWEFMEKEFAKPLLKLIRSRKAAAKEVASKYPTWSDSLTPLLEAVPLKWARADLEPCTLRVRAAVALYQQQHRGALPERLEDLTPAILPSIPIDPFSGKPLRYAKIKGGWKLWSVGDDLKNDGGEASLVFEKGWRGPDFVYTNRVRSSVDRRSRGKIKSLPGGKGRK